MRPLRRAGVCVLAVAAPVLVVVFHRAFADVTPDPMPSHWGTHGVDGTTDAGTYFAVIAAVAGVLALAAIAAIWASHSVEAGRMLTSALTFGAWIAAVPYVESVLFARDIADPYQVPMPWYGVLAGVGVPVVIAAGVYMLHGGSATAARPHVGYAPADPVGAAERVTWIGHAHSVPLRLLAVLLMAAAAILVFFHVPAAIALGVAGIVVAWASVLAVRIDRRGLHTLWGPFGWPRTHIDLDVIAHAYAEDIHPMQWGGWGYRTSTRGVAAIVRGGPALVVERTAGPTYAVTIDDPDQAAHTLNALIAGRS